MLHGLCQEYEVMASWGKVHGTGKSVSVDEMSTSFRFSQCANQNK